MSERQPTPPPVDQVKLAPPPAPPQRQDTLVERLRFFHDSVGADACRDAADEIERLRSELRRIDAIMARRPALDKPTRWENIEHAISTASQADRLRSALAALVGVDGKAELEQMDFFLRSTPGPAEDRAAAIDAVHALLATLPKAGA